MERRSRGVAPATGWLARQLVAADHNLRAAEQQVEGFLTSLFVDGWRGWSFVQNGNAVRIDIYQAIESAVAVTALHRAGFVEVGIHEHESSRFVSCICRVHTVP